MHSLPTLKLGQMYKIVSKSLFKIVLYLFQVNMDIFITYRSKVMKQYYGNIT